MAYTVDVGYYYKTGSNIFYHLMGKIITVTCDQMVYYPLNANIPGIYYVNTQTLIPQLPNDVGNSIVAGSYPLNRCMCEVFTDKFPFYYPTVNKFFVPCRAGVETYVIVLSNQTLV